MEVFEVKEYNGGCEPIGYYAKGHVEPREFITEAKHEYDVDLNIENVKHGYMRLIPALDGGMILEHSEKGRGAFAATYLDIII